MRPATAPRPAEAQRLLRIDPKRALYAHHRIDELPLLLAPGDLLVVNDAATLPASLHVVGRDEELRLVQRGNNDSEWTAVLFGKGDFRTPTESRPEPSRVGVGDRLTFGGGLVAEIVAVDAEQPRVVDVRFALSGESLFRSLYRAGRPIQYAYLARELDLWDFQNRFASRPWALEMPSAGHFLTWELLAALRARGVRLAQLTHAAGISSTGSAEIDRRFPLAERYEIGERTADAVCAAKENGGRVVAVGTTVVRALEAAFAEHDPGKSPKGDKAICASAGTARLVLGPGFRPKVADGVLSGMHEHGTSHFALLEAFANHDLLRDSLDAAESAGYLQHEFGDATLVLRS